MTFGTYKSSSTYAVDNCSFSCFNNTNAFSAYDSDQVSVNRTIKHKLRKISDFGCLSNNMHSSNEKIFTNDIDYWQDEDYDDNCDVTC